MAKEKNSTMVENINPETFEKSFTHENKKPSSNAPQTRGNTQNNENSLKNSSQDKK